MRYSRATMAQCERMPPVSATTALAVLNSGVHGGRVISQTRTSPACSFDASSSERTTLAVAVTVPGEAATPLMMLGSALGSTGRPKNRTMTSTTGSSDGGGGGPMYGGGTTRAKRSRVGLGSAARGFLLAALMGLRVLGGFRGENV